MPRTRTFHGITFVSLGGKQWETEDGKWAVEYVDDFETECMEPHPVKITKQMRDSYNHTPVHSRGRWPSALRDAIELGKRGYYCEGNDVHYYGLWVAGHAGGSDVVNREESFSDSASHLALYIQGKAESRA